MCSFGCFPLDRPLFFAQWVVSSLIVVPPRTTSGSFPAGYDQPHQLPVNAIYLIYWMLFSPPLSSDTTYFILHVGMAQVVKFEEFLLYHPPQKTSHSPLFPLRLVCAVLSLFIKPMRKHCSGLSHGRSNLD